MAEKYDAIVIGGGHNGLTCGAYLAKAGLRTLVLERREVIGGAAVSQEIVPGFTFSVFSYLMSLLHLKVIADLDLRSHGFEVLPASDMFSSLPGGDHILFCDQIAKTQASFARFSPKDAAIYPEFDQYLMDSTKIVRKLLLETPPDPSCRDWRSFTDSRCPNRTRAVSPLLSSRASASPVSLRSTPSANTAIPARKSPRFSHTSAPSRTRSASSARCAPRPSITTRPTPS